MIILWYITDIISDKLLEESEHEQKSWTDTDH